jgi:hypothetical protein
MTRHADTALIWPIEVGTLLRAATFFGRRCRVRAGGGTMQAAENEGAVR